MAPHPQRVIALFDEDCPVCRSLAVLAGRKAGPQLRLQSWQSWSQSEEAPLQLKAMAADQLRVWCPDSDSRARAEGEAGRLLEGHAAWAYLLETHQGLSTLNWLAEKLGLKERTARGLMRTGGALRRLCSRCGGRPLGRRF